MLLEVRKLFAKYEFRPKGVIQVGAHEGQEVDTFLRMGLQHGLFFEPLPEPFADLCKAVSKMKHGRAIQVALGPDDGSVTMSVEHNPLNRGQSSSCLRPKLHTTMSPDVVFDSERSTPQRRLDTVLAELSPADAIFDFLCMDVQGYEGEVLRGAERALLDVKAIITEINCAELYEGCIQVGQLDEYLGSRGFRRFDTYMAHRWWGDALYMRT